MDWLTRLVPGHAPGGAPILSVLAKKSYRFANGATAWDEDEDEDSIPMLESDELWGEGDPLKDAVRHESDLIAYKPFTDVIAVACAHAPGGRKVGQLDVGIQVDAVRKIFRVFGDRNVHVTGTGIAFTAPEPFERMPLDYSRAYGGRDERSEPGTPFVYPRNPVGKGFAVRNRPEALQDLALPNLEDPAKPLTPQNLVLGRFERWSEWPEPAGFGCVSKSFHPRQAYASAPPDAQAAADMKARLDAQRLPWVGPKPSAARAATTENSSAAPEGSPKAGAATTGVTASAGNSAPAVANALFHNGASKGLALPYLSGGETLKFANLDPEHPQFSFALPGERPRAWLDAGQGPVDVPMVLQTAFIYKESNQLTLLWRGSAYYGGLDAMRAFTSLEHGVRG